MRPAGVQCQARRELPFVLNIEPEDPGADERTRQLERIGVGRVEQVDSRVNSPGNRVLLGQLEAMRELQGELLVAVVDRREARTDVEIVDVRRPLEAALVGGFVCPFAQHELGLRFRMSSAEAAHRRSWEAAVDHAAASGEGQHVPRPGIVDRMNPDPSAFVLVFQRSENRAATFEAVAGLVFGRNAQAELLIGETVAQMRLVPAARASAGRHGSARSGRRDPW